MPISLRMSKETVSKAPFVFLPMTADKTVTQQGQGSSDIIPKKITVTTKAIAMNFQIL